MDIKKYWQQKDKIAAGTLKNMCYVYNIRMRQIKKQGRQTKKVPVKDIIMTSYGTWRNDYLQQYVEILQKYDKDGRKGDYTGTKWWTQEWADAPKNSKGQVKRRMTKFFNLYDSIRKRGFQRRTNNLPKLIDTSQLHISRDIRGYRVSGKYYRLLGMKRLFIAYHLGIEEVWCRIINIRIVQI